MLISILVSKEQTATLDIDSETVRYGHDLSQNQTSRLMDTKKTNIRRRE